MLLLQLAVYYTMNTRGSSARLQKFLRMAKHDGCGLFSAKHAGNLTHTLISFNFADGA